jgi:hypothetical protein
MADRIDVDEGAVRDIVTSDDMRDTLMDAAGPIVNRAKLLAPKRSGAGAESIRAEPVLDVFAWTVRITWTRERYYMYFHDRGTESLRAEEFLEAALEGEL